MIDLIFKSFNKDLERIAEECLSKKEVIVTKWGNARINEQGYYRITSTKQGNNMKALHRLIWEEYYGKPVPEGYVIHHVNQIKNDNRIQNLQCVEHGLHNRFHSKGKKYYKKYTLWDVSIVYYIKNNMCNGGREPKPCKCFQVKYKGYILPIGMFHDFTSVEIINDLVNIFI